nr:DNA modification methylase [Microbacterium pseudoresistens]
MAISALVIVGSSGCAMISPQATTIHYSASDGVNVPGDGPVDVRNAFFVVNEDGTIGNFVAGLVNTTDQPVTLSIEVDGLPAEKIRLGADDVISLGGTDEEPLRFAGIDAEPGSTISVYFQSGDAEGVVTEVPVLDGTLPYYADLVPTAEPIISIPAQPETPAPPTETPAS